MKTTFRSGLLSLALLLTAPVFLHARTDKATADKSMGAYLLTYFKDATHSLYMAISYDGYIFTDVHNGQPVMGGDSISEQHGIRDPHIYRGPDGAFYLTMTDLHIFGRERGLRRTEWERDGRKYGWGNNRALILMRSTDLIHWTHSICRIDKLFPEWNELGCAWAPETIYDEKEGRYMVYFTMRIGTGVNKVYYCYTDDKFTTLTTAPRQIFEYPGGKTYIDADIIQANGAYHMFYVAHDGTPGIKQAVSDRINTAYTYISEWVDSEDKACEAPNAWKRIGEQKWVVMFDCYGIQPHNFGFVETSDFKTFTRLGYFNEEGGRMKATNFEQPKHGAVIHLTRKEARALQKYWSTH